MELLTVESYTRDGEPYRILHLGDVYRVTWGLTEEAAERWAGENTADRGAEDFADLDAAVARLWEIVEAVQDLDTTYRPQANF
ncbi:MAG: hypothetical protein ONB30_02505 [candidate division KSB1 bacterium]|nr:hypothetical protein [candidate division KSB1 bacterium]